MKCIAVVGMGFGDEGKGKVVDWLVRSNTALGRDKPIVVRHSGGPQAGHHVKLNDIEHTFSHFGSGTLRGAPTYWAGTALTNPIAFMNEYDVLKKKGITPIIFIHANSPIITPYEVNWNRTKQKLSNGSCGSGIYATTRREKAGCHFTFKDLANKRIREIRYEQVANFYKNKNNHIPYPNGANDFLKACEDMLEIAKEYSTIVSSVILDGPPAVIYEGSQGLLLDQNLGFFPHVTPANTGLKNLGMHTLDIWLVTRAYQTRHGNGPMSPIVEHNIADNLHETNIENEFQGKFRKTLLDLDLLSYARCTEPKLKKTNRRHINLVVNHLDLMQEEQRLFLAGKIVDLETERKFLKTIQENLNVGGLYPAYGPSASDIQPII